MLFAQPSFNPPLTKACGGLRRVRWGQLVSLTLPRVAATVCFDSRGWAFRQSGLGGVLCLGLLNRNRLLLMSVWGGWHRYNYRKHTCNLVLYAQTATTVVSGRKVYIIRCIKYTCDLHLFLSLSLSPLPPPPFPFVLILVLLFFFFCPVPHALVSGEKEIRDRSVLVGNVTPYDPCLFSVVLASLISLLFGRSRF